MKSLLPNELLLHRAFFTEFDKYNTSYQWNNYKEEINQLLQRKIKLLLLTKGHIIVASSQLLESPFAHDLILKNKNLLNSGALLSSLRLENNSNFDFLNAKRDEQKADKENPYHTDLAVDVAKLIDDTGTTVRWNLEDNSGWFQQRLISDISDDQGLLRTTLRNQNIILPINLAKNIERVENLSRGDVWKIANSYKDAQLTKILVSYSNLVYYLSGAKTVNAEGILPQENLIDFSIGDLLGKKTKLTEYEIFFKIFIDLVQTRTAKRFPSDFLDAISINDALELRHIGIQKNFVDRYNEIQKKSKEVINTHDPEGFVLLISELEQLQSELHSDFEQALSKELPTLIKEEKIRNTGKAVHALGSLLIPGYSPESIRDLITYFLGITGQKDLSRTFNKRINERVYAIEKLLEEKKIIPSQPLIDFVGEMKKKYVEKL